MPQTGIGNYSTPNITRMGQAIARRIHPQGSTFLNTLEYLALELFSALDDQEIP